jgi:hypothetical protein
MKVNVPPVCRLVPLSESHYPSIVIQNSTSIVFGRNKDSDVVLDDQHVSG